MTTPPAALDLAALDAARPISLDPAVWSRNLVALRGVNAPLADALAGVEVPADWRPALGVDDWPTWRLESAGQAPAWLDATAAPLVRADSLIGNFNPGDRNPTLPTVGNGAELLRLLAILPSHVAVFVFVDAAAMVAACLKLHDLSYDLARGRCILVPPGHEESFLLALHDAMPGLLPPGNILRVPTVSDERLEFVRGVCQRVATRVLDGHARRLAELARSENRASVGDVLQRVALVAGGAGRDPAGWGAALGRAAESLGAEALVWPGDTPHAGHPLGLAQRLAEFSPQLTIVIDPTVAARAPNSGRVCEWFANGQAPPGQAGEVQRLAGSPRIRDTLLRAGVPAAQVIEFWWAAEASSPERDRSASLDDALVLVGDYADLAPAQHGIDQPTHKLLWEQMQRGVAARWRATAVGAPAAELADAERSSGIRVSDPALRAALLGLLERVLIPAVLLGTIAEACAASRTRVFVLGKGWTHCPAANLNQLAPSFRELCGPAGKPRGIPRAALVIGVPDPLTPELVQCAAWGWPLCACGTSGAGADLGGVLHPGQHFEAVGSQRELRAALDSAVQDRPRWLRRSEQTRARISREHTFSQRLRALGAQLGFTWPAGRSGP